MCHEVRFFRSWTTSKMEKRESNKPVTERDPLPPMPIRPGATHEVERRKEVERELEEIV